MCEHGHATIDLGIVGCRHHQCGALEGVRSEVRGDVVNAAPLEPLRDGGAEVRRHHPDIGVGLEQQTDLARRHLAAADHQAGTLPYVEEHR